MKTIEYSGVRTAVATNHADLLKRMKDGREISYITALPDRLAELGLIRLVRHSGRRREYMITDLGLEAVRSLEQVK